MRPESVGQVEAGIQGTLAEVTRLYDPEPGDSQLCLQISASPGSSSIAAPAAQPRPVHLLTRLRSTMASWRSAKSKSPAAAENAPLSGSEEERETEADSRDTRLVHHKRGQKWARSTYMFGLFSLSIVLLVADVSEKLARHLLGVRNTDPFGNWGKPGTGTEELAWYPTEFLRDVVPIPCHSHNDYWRKVPLFSALHTGCMGVEVDVWLRNNDLLVGHDKPSLHPNRTFQTLYVHPLVEILSRKNPDPDAPGPALHGVFDTNPKQTLVLLVDLKTGGAETWPWVVKQLAPLRERGWLSYYEDGQFHSRPITVVGTGNTPFDQIVGESMASRRDAFFDAPLHKLENSAYNWTNSYYASVKFTRAVGAVWWRSAPSPGQVDKIRAHLREARERGLVSRYWGLPAWPIHLRNKVWDVLVQEGIGMLNVDDLEGAAKQDWSRPGTF